VNAIARILEGSDLLRLLVSRTMPGERTKKMLAGLGLTSLSRRSSSPVTKSLSCADTIADLIELWGRSSGDRSSAVIDKAFSHVDKLASRLIDPSVAAVMGREDGCLRSFQTANEVGAATIYQLPTAYYTFVRDAMEREMDQFPGAAMSTTDEYEYALHRCDRKERELQAAQHVLCPSTFVQRTLPEWLGGRITTIPLGVDAQAWSGTRLPKEPLFLYVGNISMRKGIHRLLLAWKKLRAYRTHTLRLIGDMRLSSIFLRDFSGMFEWTNRIPRNQLASHYSSAAAFIFNALADGFGHVFVEAMSCKTAVLCSRSCGGPDLVTDGVEGKLFDYGDNEQLTSILEWALSNPAALEQMGNRAATRAAKSDWTNFAAIFLPWISSVVAGRPPR
jgi:alpha-maltose-1-phosphate synthase